MHHLVSSQPLQLTIATRQSRLALWQAHNVQTLLEQRGHQVNILGMITEGDRALNRPLSQIGGKGLFVKEIERALQDGRADLAVHSLKDVPVHMPAAFSLACVPEREDPCDAWVSARYASLQDMPAGATVGTSSLRRTMQIQALRPDLRITSLRGNVETRLHKLDAGMYDGIVLAAAGLKRLGLENRIRQRLAPEVMLPAGGQGALAIEICSARTDLHAVLAPLTHQPTWLQVTAERAVSRALGGNCTAPLAAYACFSSAHTLWLRAAWGMPDGSILRAAVQAPCSSLQQAEDIGRMAAQQLIRQGATHP